MKEFTQIHLAKIIENHFDSAIDSVNHEQKERLHYILNEVKPYIDFHKQHSEDVFKAHLYSEQYKIYYKAYETLITRK
jgi:hypothetical protein